MKVKSIVMFISLFCLSIKVFGKNLTSRYFASTHYSTSSQENYIPFSAEQFKNLGILLNVTSSAIYLLDKESESQDKIFIFDEETENEQDFQLFFGSTSNFVCSFSTEEKIICTVYHECMPEQLWLFEQIEFNDLNKYRNHLKKKTIKSEKCW